MGQEIFREIFQYPRQEFKSHLESVDNERIIFSGKYGSGKTKFLEDFFEAENQQSLFGKKKYDVYRLFPTNYSIASNQDILRYIKYDIIIEMLKNGIQFEEVEKTVLESLPEYVKENWLKVIAALVYMIPKLGKEIIDSFKKIEKLKEEYLNYHKKINESSGDKLSAFLQGIENNEGSLYESDITTSIIVQSIEKNKAAQKESILIIDDVDRLNPEHVFRVLNIFASHF